MSRPAILKSCSNAAGAEIQRERQQAGHKASNWAAYDYKVPSESLRNWLPRPFLAGI